MLCHNQISLHRTMSSSRMQPIPSPTFKRRTTPWQQLVGSRRLPESELEPSRPVNQSTFLTTTQDWHSLSTSLTIRSHNQYRRLFKLGDWSLPIPSSTKPRLSYSICSSATSEVQPLPTPYWPLRLPSLSMYLH